MRNGLVQNERIETRTLEEEMRNSFIDYSMSVIVQRALPDARDGLKPVHRRILYAMRELGLDPARPYKKSATVVGDVLGKYHPHGDGAVYDSIVRMVQDFSLRYPLIDGQGNFGSIDGDRAAAYRYTEVRLTPLALELLADIDRDTVDEKPNFDGRLLEPEVLPSRLPHLLLNGTDGIAVGMATKIPPHNIVELLTASEHLVANPDCELDDLMARVRGPDFPTGGYIWGRDGLESAYRTGRGLIDMRARLHVEEGRFGKRSLVVTEVPYQVNKTRVIEQIARMVKTGRTDAITELRDESDRDGIRLVIELKRDADPNKVVSALFKKTQLRYTFGVIMLALVDGRPEELDLKKALDCFVVHRLEVIRRRAAFELSQSEDRAHVVEGLLLALHDIDRVIELIRESRTPSSAHSKLRAEFRLSERQANAILAMRLAQLTGLEQRKLETELGELKASILELRELVEDDAKRRDFLRRDLRALIAEYGDPRRTVILSGDGDFPIPAEGAGAEATLLLLSRQGYVKAQAALGGGLAGVEAMEARQRDYVESAHLCRGSDSLLVVSRRGHAHELAVADLPRGTRSSRGRRLEDFVQLDGDDSVAAVLPVDDFGADRFLLTVSLEAQVKRTPLRDYANIRSGGIIAAGVGETDALMAAFITDGSRELVLATRSGLAIRFREEEIRPMGRTAQGVRGIQIPDDDALVAALVPRRDAELLVATERGFGKRVPFTELRLQGRAGKGTTVLPDRKKAGDMVALLEIQPGGRVMWENARGEAIASEADSARMRPRRGASHRIIRLDDAADRIIDVYTVRSSTGTSLEDGESAGAELTDRGRIVEETDRAGRLAQAELDLADSAEEGKT